MDEAARELFESETDFEKIATTSPRIIVHPLCRLLTCITPSRQFNEHRTYIDDFGRLYRPRIYLTAEAQIQNDNRKLSSTITEKMIYMDYTLATKTEDVSEANSTTTERHFREMIHPRANDVIVLHPRRKLVTDSMPKSIEMIARQVFAGSISDFKNSIINTREARTYGLILFEILQAPFGQSLVFESDATYDIIHRPVYS